MSELFYTRLPRTLSDLETLSLVNHFPLGDISKVKNIGKGSAIVDSLADPLCNTHRCFQGANVTFHNEKNSYTPYLSIGYNKYKPSFNDDCLSDKDYCTKDEKEESDHRRISDEFLRKVVNPCISDDFTCIDHKSVITYASFNCIGWALGISNFYTPENIGNSPKQLIVQAIENARKLVLPSNPTNVLNILEKFDLDHISTTPILKNNTIAFYFHTNLNKNGEVSYHMHHAARFLTTLSDGTSLNNWSSKWGSHPELFAHDYEYMLNTANPSVCKINLVCYDTVYFVPIINEEIIGESSNII